MTEKTRPIMLTNGAVPWPEDLAAEYTRRGWWRGQSLGSELWASADSHAESIAVIDGDIQLTYSSLTARADELATQMVDALGLTHGDRIVVQLDNCWQFAVLTLACLRAGIIPVMALPAHRHHELAHLVQTSEAVALVVPAETRGFDHQAMADEISKSCETLRTVMVVASDTTSIRRGYIDLTALCVESPDADRQKARWDANPPNSREVAVLLLSGGTTGLPKLIARTHDDYSYNVRAAIDISGLNETSVYLAALPASHNFSLACPGMLGALLVGGRLVMSHSSKPDEVFPLIRSMGVTHTAVVPAVVQRWLAYATEVGADDLNSLRVVQVGGARIANEVARQIRPILGATLQQAFGMAEGLCNFTRLDDPEEVICETQGRPISPGDEIRIVNELDEDVPPGELGVLLTRGPYTPRGYYRAAEHNAISFTSDGWYRSGDIVYLRPDGNLVVAGRDKDMINRGGEKVSAEEVENVIYRLATVAQVAAVAMPDADLGERLCVYIVPREGSRVTMEDVLATMRGAGVAKYKWPERVELVQELPTTKVGKIDKKALREAARKLSRD
ncbi:(2,3-dihydroxybenzoyl)adenylate synthase [bacterium RCC_150]